MNNYIVVPYPLSAQSTVFNIIDQRYGVVLATERTNAEAQSRCANFNLGNFSMGTCPSKSKNA